MFFFVFMMFVLSFLCEPYSCNWLRRAKGSCNSWLKIYVPSPARNLLLSFVVYCCSSCRFLLSVPSPARNLFVVHCCLCCRFLLFFSSHARNLVVLCCSSCRFLLSVPSPARNPLCCPLLFIVVLVVVFFFPFRAMRGTPFFVPCCLLLF